MTDAAVRERKSHVWDRHPEEAVVSVADQIVSNATLQVKTAALLAEHGSKIGPYLPAIESKVVKSLS